MPLPRSKDTGGGAPVYDIMKARVRLFDVEEHTEPFTVTRKSDGATFTLDPQLKCQVEIVDDYGDGSFNGATFFESFRYKYNKREQRWENAENSKLGALTEVRKPRYFEDASIPDLTEDDLEEFELECRVKPRKTPDGRVTGSRIAWETMRPVQTAKAKARAMSQAEAEEDDDFDDVLR